MGQTFYTALGVEADADVETIRDAYRSRVKESHPDVSDDPGAPREFRRLTAARDVLTDETERARYDRLGHRSYVARHVETSAWSATDGGGAGRSTAGTDADASGGSGDAARTGSTSRSTGATAAGNGPNRHRRANPGGDDRSAWLGDDWERPREQRRRTRRRARSARSPRWSDSSNASAWSESSSSSRWSGTSTASSATTSSESAGSTYQAGEAAWQHASAAYQYTPTWGASQSRTDRRSLRHSVASVAPWLLVHLVLFVSAVAMAWFMYVGTAAIAQFSVLAVVFGVLLVGLVALLSVLHLVSVVVG